MLLLDSPARKTNNKHIKHIKICQLMTCCEDNQAELGGQSGQRNRWLFYSGGLGSLSDKGVLRVKDLRGQPSKKKELQRHRPWGGWLQDVIEENQGGKRGWTRRRRRRKGETPELYLVGPHRAWSGWEFTLNETETLQRSEKRNDSIGIKFQRTTSLALRGLECGWTWV